MSTIQSVGKLVSDVSVGKLVSDVSVSGGSTSSPEWDLIIVDEADSVLAGKNKEFFEDMILSQEHLPYVAGFTGTADSNLLELL
jgi:hypothetical protein